MKRYFLFALLFLMSPVIFAQADTAIHFESKEIGRKIEVPSGWRFLDPEDTEELDSVGNKMLENGLGRKIDYGFHKNLLGFRKDSFNSFFAAIELANIDSISSEKTNSYVNQLICKTLIEHNIKFDTSSSRETIDGLRFNVFKVITYRPNGEIFLTQETYSRLINKWIFSVVLSYNNETDKKALVDIWNRSIF